MLKEKLENILKQVANSQDLINYEICPSIDVLRGDGFLSEGYEGEVISKGTESKIQTYIKIQPPYLFETTSPSYGNEYCFYSTIFPELNKFQIEKSVETPFQNIPKFYCGDDKEGNKYIAMENLKTQNYVLVDKSKNIDRDHLKVAFETYGRFHALSFAFKDQNIEKYSMLTEPLTDILCRLGKAIKDSFTSACDAVKDMDIDIYKKIEPIKENLEESFIRSATYNGKYSGLTHGDCWSNNLLFKYGEKEQIEDIKLLDHQFCRDSTPIHDLSYFFYSGASKEDFKKLDEYLEIYHKSFSTFAEELGSDPEKLLPLSVLKLEWKKYGLFGIILGIMLWAGKLTQKHKIENLAASGLVQEEYHKNAALVMKSDTFKENTSDILLHAVEYGII